MGHARILRRVNCSTSKTIAEDKSESKLLKLYGIISAAQLKIKKLTRREIVENTKSNWFIRDPAVSQNNSKPTLHLCPFAKCKFEGNKIHMKYHKFQSHPTIMPYKCEASGCKYASNQHALFIRHMKQSHKILRPQFVCSYSSCDFKARYKPNYKNHFIKVHTKKPYACETCGGPFKSMHNLKYHVMTHFGNKISCPFPSCEYQYKPVQSSGFKRHMLTHTNEKPHKCHHCGWRASPADHLKLHLQVHEDPSTRAKLRIYKCTFEGCSYSSNQNGHLKSHMTTHSKNKPFKCTWSKCIVAFRIKSNLNRHMKSHSKDKRYICNFCNSVYTRSERLIVHMRSHTGEKPYKCSYQNCKYATAEPKDIKKHEKFRHNDEIRKRSFTCGFCQKSFLEKPTLERHMRTHTGERPYSCQYCNRGFTGSSDRNVHERICKMRPDGKIIKPFNCQFCESAFVTKFSKKLHEMCCKLRDDGKIIKPFKCQYCLKEFTWINSLTRYERCCRSRPDRIIIKPFKCSFQNCKHASTCRSNLRQHKKIHPLVQ